jgi:hypothetical protein
MCSQVRDTYDMGGVLVLHEVWSNASQPADPTPAGYVSTDGGGAVITQRALAADEVAQFAAQDTADALAANRATLTQRATTALTTNATYLAIPTPTTAQAVAQVAALTRQSDAVIRLLLNQLTATT